MTSDSHASGSDPVGPALAHYARVLRVRWKTIVAGGLVGVLLTVSFMALRPPTVTATTILQVEIITTNPFALDRAASTLLDASTEQQIASSYVVAARAAAELGDDITPRQVQTSASATVDPNATIVRIRYSATRESDARQGADAVAHAYLAHRGDEVGTRIADQLDAIDIRLEELSEVQAATLAALSSAEPGSGAEAAAESDLRLTSQETDSLVRERTSLRAISTSGGRVLTSADVSDVVYSPSRSVLLVGGFVAGLGLGVVLAFVRHHTSSRLITRYDVARLTGAPVWGPDEHGDGIETWDSATELLLASRQPDAERIGVVSVSRPSRAFRAAVRAFVDEADGDISEVRFLEAEARIANILRVARNLDAVVLSADCSRCPHQRLRAVAEALNQVQCPVLGVIDVPVELAHDSGTEHVDRPTPTVESTDISAVERLLVRR